MNKKLLLTLCVTLFVVGSLSAAEPESVKRREQVRAMKIGYITEQITLSSKQSVAFWPVYNEYWQERFKVYDRKRKLFEKISSSIATQEQLNELCDVEDDHVEVIKRFSPRFLEILSADQTAKLFVAEEGFKSILLRNLQ